MISVFFSEILNSGIFEPLKILFFIPGIIILVTGAIGYFLRFLYGRILINKHYKIISELEQEYYELNILKKIPYILNSARKIRNIYRMDGLLSNIILYFGLYLEKGGIITNTYWDSLNRNGLNSPLFPNAQPALDAQIIIEKKKKLLLSLLEKIRNLEVNVVKELLIDLRSDLSIRLAEQQSLLESAKGEVEKNIQGTSELNQVSELQKIRLDKQIEQFEELQRVLVKV